MKTNNIVILVIVVLVIVYLYNNNKKKKEADAVISNVSNYVPSVGINTPRPVLTSPDPNQTGNTNTGSGSNITTSNYKVGDEIYVAKTPVCLYATPSESSEKKTCYYIKDTLVGTYLGMSSDNKFMFVESDEYFAGGGPFGVFGSATVYVKPELVYSK